MAATPVGHPDRARILRNLGECLSTRFKRTRNAKDYESACTAWETAEKSCIAHPVVCAKSAQSATRAQTNLGRFQAAYRDSLSVMKLLHQASSRAIEREEYILGQISGTSSLAASLALETGEPASTAPELPEFGVESFLATQETMCLSWARNIQLSVLDIRPCRMNFRRPSRCSRWSAM